MIGPLEGRHTVVGLHTANQGIDVTFDGPAAIYLLPEDIPDFAGCVARLAESWRTGEPVAVRLAGDRIDGVG